MARKVESHRRGQGAGRRHQGRTARALRAADEIHGVRRRRAAVHAAGHDHRAEILLQLLPGVPALAEQRVAAGEQVDLLEAVADVEVRRVDVVAGEVHPDGDGHAAGRGGGIASRIKHVGRSCGHDRHLADDTVRACRRSRRVVAAAEVAHVRALADGLPSQRRAAAEPGAGRGGHGDQPGSDAASQRAPAGRPAPPEGHRQPVQPDIQAAVHGMDPLTSHWKYPLTSMMKWTWFPEPRPGSTVTLPSPLRERPTIALLARTVPALKLRLLVSGVAASPG
jgi:hypothetical protein